MRARSAIVDRKTTETQIRVGLVLDGAGKARIQTTLPFLDHMLAQLAKHGRFDLTVSARGDTHVDDHHTVEDIGIVLGEAFARAVGDKAGVRRFGFASIPLDDALAQVSVDLSGRPYLAYRVHVPARRRIKAFAVDLFEEFFRAFVTHGRLTLHVQAAYGKDPHHVFEAVFKALGRALGEATRRDAGFRGIPSTKGRL